MKLIDAINTIDRSQKNSNLANLEDFCQALDLDFYSSYDWSAFSNKVQAYWLTTWYCTDQRVGIQIYFMDDEFIAVGHQIARKETNNIEFKDQETAIRVRDWMLTLHKEQRRLPVIDPKELDQEIGTVYRVNYPEQLIADWGYHDGRKVIVHKKSGFLYRQHPGRDHMIEVHFEESPEVIFKIPLDQFQIPYHTIDAV